MTLYNYTFCCFFSPAHQEKEVVKAGGQGDGAGQGGEEKIKIYIFAF